jgi:hypothetical protein
MNLYIDAETGELLNDPTDVKTVSQISVKRGDVVTLNLGIVGGAKYTTVGLKTTAYRQAVDLGATASLQLTARTPGTIEGAPIAFVDAFRICGEATRATGVAVTSGLTVSKIGINYNSLGPFSGEGYSSPPAVEIIPKSGAGSGATAVATVSPLSVNQIDIISGGKGYNGQPKVNISKAPFFLNTLKGGWQAYTTVVESYKEFAQAAACATVENGGVTAIEVTSPGGYYWEEPIVTIDPPDAETALVTSTVESGSISQLLIKNHGSGYASVPAVSFSGGGGSNAAATAVIVNCALADLIITNVGTGYTTPPTVTIEDPVPVAATATAYLSGMDFYELQVYAGGDGYTTSPTVTLSGGGKETTTNAAHATVRDGVVQSIEIIEELSGYTSAPAVTIAAPGLGATAKAVAVLQPHAIVPTVTEKGSGYTVAPLVRLINCGESEAVATVNSTTGVVESVTLTNEGDLVSGTPVVEFYGGEGFGATAEVILDKQRIESITVTDGGGGAYGVALPTIAFSGGGGSGAAGYPTISGGVITGVVMTDLGSGYTSTPTATVTGACTTPPTIVPRFRLRRLP